MKKTIALLLAFILVVGVTIGGTIAWLTAQTPEVKNTFTVGDINLELWEHAVKSDDTLDESKEVTTNSYHYVPGDTLNKDPFVRVKATSEDCYLFLKVGETGNIDVSYVDAAGATQTEKALQYTIDNAVWTPVPNNEGYWYCTVNNVTADTTFNILKDKQVKVSPYITKDSVLETTAPTLTFWAAAVQSENLPDGTENKTEVEVAFGLVEWPAETSGT